MEFNKQTSTVRSSASEAEERTVDDSLLNSIVYI